MSSIRSECSSKFIWRSIGAGLCLANHRWSCDKSVRAPGRLLCLINFLEIRNLEAICRYLPEIPMLLRRANILLFCRSFSFELRLDVRSCSSKFPWKKLYLSTGNLIIEVSRKFRSILGKLEDFVYLFRGSSLMYFFEKFVASFPDVSDS